MIQVVLLEKKDYINEYKHFQNYEIGRVIQYVEEAIQSKVHTTIQITKWDDKTGERL